MKKIKELFNFVKTKFIQMTPNKINENDDVNDSSKEMRKHIDNYRHFTQKSYILSYVSDLFDNKEILDSKRILLLFEVDKQRTYLLKTNDEFIIINDNRGDIIIVLKSPIDKLKYIIDSQKDYMIIFEYFKQPLRASKKLFFSKEILRNKIDSL